MAQEKQAEKKEVVETKTASVPSLDMSSLEEFAGAGAENITSNDVSLPFLKILTNNSPQVTQGDSKFIENARPGQVINTVLNKLYKNVCVIYGLIRTFQENDDDLTFQHLIDEIYSKFN